MPTMACRLMWNSSYRINYFVERVDQKKPGWELFEHIDVATMSRKLLDFMAGACDSKLDLWLASIVGHGPH